MADKKLTEQEKARLKVVEDHLETLREEVERYMKERVTITERELCPECVKNSETIPRLVADGNRGLCHACYRTWKRRIDAGKTTEEQLVELGVLLPKQQSGRKPKGDVQEILKERAAEKYAASKKRAKAPKKS